MSLNFSNVENWYIKDSNNQDVEVFKVTDSSNNIIYQKTVDDYADEPFAINKCNISNTDVNVKIINNTSDTHIFNWSYDNSTWHDTPPITSGSNTTISFGNNPKIYFKHTGKLSDNNVGIVIGVLGGDAYLSGNLSSLYTGNNFDPLIQPTLSESGCFSYVFSGASGIKNAEFLIFPNTTLPTYCYSYMFLNSNIKLPPKKLPSGSVSAGCYYNMFSGCTSLTTAPELPATTLASRCYEGMFLNCISLTSAPELPASNLSVMCYNDMFKNCTNLNYIKCLATAIPPNGSTYNWVSGVASTGTFVKAASMLSWTTGVNGIPSGWSIING